MGSTKCSWKGSGIQTFHDSASFETVHAMAPIKFEDDFLNTDIMTQASGVVGWTIKDTSTTGDTTPAIVANQPGGIIRLKLDSTNEKQESGIYFGDALNFNLDKGPIFEARLTASTLPTDQSEIYFGFANAYVEGPISEADAGPTVHAFFCLDGSGAVLLFTDDASTDNNQVSSGVTHVAGTHNIFKIDCSDVTDVRFYIDGARVGSGTTFDMSNGTNVVVQPFLICHKETGTGLGVCDIDYVRVWSPR